MTLGRTRDDRRMPLHAAVRGLDQHVDLIDVLIERFQVRPSVRRILLTFYPH
jgi:hypothetical protein